MKKTRRALAILLSIVMVMTGLSVVFSVQVAATYGDTIRAHANYTGSPALQQAFANLGAAFDAAAAAGAFDTNSPRGIGQWSHADTHVNQAHARGTGGGTFGNQAQQGTDRGGRAYNPRFFDESDGGHIFAIAQAFYALVQTPGFATNANLSPNTNASPFPFTWWSNMWRGLLSYYDFAARSPQGVLIAALTNVLLNTNYSGADSDGRNGIHLRSENMHYSWMIDRLGDPPVTESQPRTARDNTGSLQFNVTEIGAFRLAGFANMTEVRAAHATGGVETRMSWGWNSGRGSNQGHTQNDSFWGFNTATFANPTTVNSNTLTGNLIAFEDYFLVGSPRLIDTDPLVLTYSEVNDLVADNAAIYSAVVNNSALNGQEMENLFGTADFEAVQDFMTAALAAQLIFRLRANREFFHPDSGGMDDPGFNYDILVDEIHYGQTFSESLALLAQALFHHEQLVSMPPAQAAIVHYHLGTDLVAIEEAIAALQTWINLRELWGLRVAIEDNYIDLVAEPNALQALTDARLETLIMLFAGYIASLGTFDDADIAEVFPEGTVWVAEFLYALEQEALNRGLLQSSAREMQRWFLEFIRRDLNQPTQTLIDWQRDAYNNRAVFITQANALAGSMSNVDFFFFYNSVITPADAFIDAIYAVLAGRLRAQVDSALEFGNEITWDNLSEARRAVNSIEMVWVGADNMYRPLIWNHLINSEAGQSHLANDPTLIHDYNQIYVTTLSHLTAFLRGGAWHNYVPYEHVYPVRHARPDDLARVEGQDFEVTNEMLTNTVEALDALLTGDAAEALLGQSLDNMLEEMLDGLWSDALVNTLVELLYHEVLTAFEDEWADLGDMIVDLIADAGMTVLPQNLYFGSLRHVLTRPNGTPNRAGWNWSNGGNTLQFHLRLLPEMLANAFEVTTGPQAVPAADRATLAPVAAQLRTARPAGYWQGLPLTAPAPTAANQTYAWNVYPTNIWACPNLRDADGVLNLNWGVDEPWEGHVMYNATREERFLWAAGYALTGVWSLLRALLAGQPLPTQHGTGFIGNSPTATETRIMNRDAVSISTLATGMGFPATASDGRLSLTVAVEQGTLGYSEVIVPLFENVLGITNAPLATPTQLRAMTNTHQLAEAIFRPIIWLVTEELPSGPLSMLTQALPNLVYAMATDLIVHMLRQLEVNVLLQAGATVVAVGMTCDLRGTGLAGGAINNDDLNVPLPLNVWDEIAGGLDVDFLGDTDLLIDMLSETLFGLDENGFPSARLPRLPVGQLIQSGVVIGPEGSTVRAPRVVTWWERVEETIQQLLPVLDANGVYVFEYTQVGTESMQQRDADGNPVYDNGVPVMVDVPVLEYQQQFAWQDVVVVTFVERTTTATNNRWYIDADSGDVVLTLLRYLTGVMANPDALDAILDMVGLELPELVDEIINNMTADPDSVIAALVELFNPMPSGFYAMREYSWGFVEEVNGEFVTTNPEHHYTDWWTEEDATFLSRHFNTFIDNVMRLLGLQTPDGQVMSIEGIIASLLESVLGSTTIYTADLLNGLTGMIGEAIGEIGLDEMLNGAILPLLYDETGIDLETWINFTDEQFTFADGDRNGFVEALVEMLTPLAPLFDFLLGEEEFGLLGIRASGAAGYAYGIVPLFEALGVQDMATPAELAALTDDTALIRAIVNPLLDVVDAILADPFNELMSRLPNLVYFAYSGGLEVAINNILHAVNVLQDTVRPIYSVDLLGMLLEPMGIPLSFEGLQGLADMLAGLLGGSFSLSADTLAILLTGELEQFTSANGQTAFRLVPNPDDVFSPILLFVIDFIFRDNMVTFINMLAEGLDMGDDFVRQADAVVRALYDVFTLGAGPDAVLWHLMNIFRTVGAFTSAGQSLLDAFNRNWVALLDAMRSSDLILIRNFGHSLANFLDRNFGGVFDSTGIAADGLVPWFNAIIAWFRRILNPILGIFGWSI